MLTRSESLSQYYRHSFLELRLLAILLDSLQILKISLKKRKKRRSPLQYLNNKRNAAPGATSSRSGGFYVQIDLEQESRKAKDLSPRARYLPYGKTDLCRPDSKDPTRSPLLSDRPAGPGPGPRRSCGSAGRLAGAAGPPGRRGRSRPERDRR